MWDGVAPELAKRWTVINVDFRGHGASTAPFPFSIEDLAADWLAVMDHENVERAALVGLSLGGMTAMRVALAAPERVACLGLLDTSADPEPRWNRIKYRAMAEMVRRLGHRDVIYGTVRKIMFGPSTLARDPALADRELERMRKNDPRQLYHAVRAVIDRGSIHARLGELRVPTLVMVGDEDRATPRSRSDRIVDGVKGATLRVIPKAGHLAAVEQPEAVAGALVQFLEGAWKA
jgi:pimeloyl-ACP methyl ester carboxylesterase